VPGLEPEPPLVAGAWAVELVPAAAPVGERSSPEQTRALEPVAAFAQEPAALPRLPVPVRALAPAVQALAQA
jgi:hypothetical protein